MDPIGLAVGLIGLAGLFSTCLGAVERFDSWRNFTDDSRLMRTLVEGQKLRLKRWGHVVGFDNGVVSAAHHEALDDPQILAMIRMNLLEIQSICDKVDGNTSHTVAKDVDDAHLLQRPPNARPGLLPESRRLKMKWALRDKAKFTSKAQTLAFLVQNLHDVVPLGEVHSKASSPQGAFVSSAEGKCLSIVDLRDRLILPIRFVAAQ